MISLINFAKSTFENLLNVDDRMADDTIQEDLLKGKALQVYWYLLTHGVKGIREIQKDLNIFRFPM